MNPDEDAKKVEQLLEVPRLAEALESDQFKQFLDHVPFAVAVSEMQPSERMVYANLEFERLTGRVASEIYGKQWSSLLRNVADKGDGRPLSQAITEDEEYLGEFASNARMQSSPWMPGRTPFRMTMESSDSDCSRLPIPDKQRTRNVLPGAVC
jgi:PAS domain-containing protein